MNLLSFTNQWLHLERSTAFSPNCGIFSTSSPLLITADSYPWPYLFVFRYVSFKTQLIFQCFLKFSNIF